MRSQATRGLLESEGGSEGEGREGSSGDAIDFLQRVFTRREGREGEREGGRGGLIFFSPVLVCPVPVEGAELFMVADAVENDARLV